MSVYRQLLCVGCWESLLSCVSDFIQLLCSPCSRFGRAKNKPFVSVFTAAYWDWSMAHRNFAVSFPGTPCSKFCSCVQALQSWCYSRSQLSDLCADLTMPPRATTVTLSCYKAIRNSIVTSYVCVCRSGC